MAQGDMTSMETKVEPTKRYQEKMCAMTLKRNFSGKCRSWYKNKDGVNFILWPGTMMEYWWITRTVKFIEDFRMTFAYNDPITASSQRGQLAHGS